MKRKYFRRKRRIFRRKRTTRRSSKYARRQQKAASTWIRKKYTRTFLLDVANGEDTAGLCISLIGGKNQQNATFTKTLFDVNQDNQLRTDMGLYQFFRIRGVAVKMFFPMPTTVETTPCQWAIGYSMSDVMAPALPAARLQTLATYQTGPCSQTKSISRYYNTANTYRRFGIQYASTDEFASFNSATALYGGQLLTNQGSSVIVRAIRNTTAGAISGLARLELTYYVTYKGNKGTSSLTTV